jgi:hypothetical protein
MTTLPDTYRSTTRTLLRFAIVMLALGLLSGVAFQESSKKLDYAEIAAGERLEAVLSLALVHGHMLVTGVLMPIALAAALDLARRSGGSELSTRTLRWLTWGYVPFTAATLALMLYKGYHTLLSVRFGARDFDAIDAAYFGGLVPLRHAVYGLTHVGMAVSLGVVGVALWRSLKPAAR